MAGGLWTCKRLWPVALDIMSGVVLEWVDCEEVQ